MYLMWSKARKHYPEFDHIMNMQKKPNDEIENNFTVHFLPFKSTANKFDLESGQNCIGKHSIIKIAKNDTRITRRMLLLKCQECCR